jgi:glycosyltransferase involved in cell wall biosynthesis
VLPGLIPSTLISVVKPLTGLHRAGSVDAKITLESLARRSDLEAADVVVFCRNFEPRFGYLIEACRQLGTPFIYDLDDNFFALPPTSEEGRYHRDPIRIEQLTRYLAAATLVRVYSEPLERRVRSLNPRIERVAGSIDWSLIPEAPSRNGPGPVKIVYVTSRIEDELAAAFLPDVAALLERHPGEVEVSFWGHHPRQLRGRPGVRFLPLVPDYDRFLRRLATSGFDIGLAPLLDDEFHRSKTNNKFREYGACRIAGVYSDVEVYSSCVRDGETGLLVPPRPGAWLEALERLVQDAALRSAIQVAAREHVRRHYSQERAETEWLRQIQTVRGADAAGLPASPAGAASPAGFPAPPRGPWASLKALGGKGGRLLGRVQRLGLRPTLYGVYRYLYGLWLLFRIQRQLTAARPWPRS